MLGTVAVLGIALTVVGIAAWWLLRQRSMSSAQSTAIMAVSMWVTASAVVAWRLDEPRAEARGRSELVQSLDSLAWPDASSSAPAPVATLPSSPAGVQAGPVESLVGGLEARLAAQPNDAEGWALLAQAYAFTANEEAVERAVQRAVALGFDEPALRDRVASAERSAPRVDWVDRAIGAQRQ
jgi:cytochrome c-type biogenesis protein CcmH/NrfG